MPAQLIAAVFPSRKLLTKALDHLMETRDLAFAHAAIVAKAASGEVVVLNDDIGPNEGGIAGGTLGAAMAALGVAQLGALALPGIGAIIAVGAGALVGGVIGQLTGRFAANLIDPGTRAPAIEALKDKLQAGHPALVIEAEDGAAALPRLREMFQRFRVEWVEVLPGMG